MVLLTNTGKQTLTLRLPAKGDSCTAVDVMDNPSTLPAPDRLVTLSIGSSPVFLYGIDWQALASLSQFRILSDRRNLRPGEPFVFHVQTGPEVKQVKFTLESVDGIAKLLPNRQNAASGTKSESEAW